VKITYETHALILEFSGVGEIEGSRDLENRRLSAVSRGGTPVGAWQQSPQ